MAESAAFGVRLEGLTELEHAFSLTSKALGRELQTGLIRAAGPVRQDAAGLAVARMRNIGFKWSQMRVGVSRKESVVYVAPVARGIYGRATPHLRRGRKFADPLMDRAMIPALHKNIPEIERIVDETLEKVNGQWARG